MTDKAGHHGGQPDGGPGEPGADFSGLLYGLPAIWLRDNCRCRKCWDPASGQRLVTIIDLPADVSVIQAQRSGNRIEVIFGPDRHQAVFDAAWLSQFGVTAGSDDPGREKGHDLPAWAPAGRDVRTEDAKRLWAGQQIASAFPQGSWELLQSEAAHRQACLEAVLRDGFVLIRGVPAEPGTVQSVARFFGGITSHGPATGNGPVIDVRVGEQPMASTFTSKAVTPRSGLAFRDPLPTLQLEHCLEQDPNGGETIVVDGFEAAGQLRGELPSAFWALASTEVTFAFRHLTFEMGAVRPVIGVNARGRIREVRLDPELMQPLPMPPPELIAFYDAYRAFAELLARPRLAAAFRMRPGDCLVLDNTRILTGRSAFTSNSRRRHMQLCWAEIDALTSELSVLRRPKRNGHAR